MGACFALAYILWIGWDRHHQLHWLHRGKLGVPGQWGPSDPDSPAQTTRAHASGSREEVSRSFFGRVEGPGSPCGSCRKVT